MSIDALAAAQLVAYNAADLDGFVDCYHPDVVVLDGQVETVSGLTAFRARYVSLFGSWQFGAEVPQRMVHNDQCFDYETWWRVDPSTGQRSEGTVVVRYVLRDGKIGTVQFFR